MVRIASWMFGLSVVVLLAALVAKTWVLVNKPSPQRQPQRTSLPIPGSKEPPPSREPVRPEFTPPERQRVRSECDPAFIASQPKNIQPLLEKACAGLTVAKANQAAARQQEFSADAKLRSAKAKRQTLQLGVLDAEDALALQALLFEADMKTEDDMRAFGGQLNDRAPALGLGKQQFHDPDPQVFISGQKQLMQRRLTLSQKQREWDFKLREANADVESAQSLYEAAAASRLAADAQLDVAQAEFDRILKSY